MSKETLAEIKKGFDLWTAGTYNESEFYSHMIAIVRDAGSPGLLHKQQLERLMFKVKEMRESQRLFWGGHKNKLGECKSQESEMDKKIMNLELKGYSIERFTTEKPKQTNLF